MRKRTLLTAALYSAIAIPALGFVLPSVCMMYYFKSRDQLKTSIIKPYK
jgi:hypothetical protein